ncbi:MAG: repeat containing protein [Verrucomicrobiota bacterium]
MRFIIIFLLLAAVVARAQITDPAPAAPSSDYARLATDYASLHSRYTNLATSARIVITELKKEDARLLQLVTDLQQQLTDLKVQAHESTQQTAEQKKQTADARQLADQLQTDLTAALARVTTLENKPAPDLLKQTDDLKAINTQLKQQADDLRQQAEAARQLADQTQAELTNTITRLTGTNAAQLVQVAQLTQENHDLKQQADDLIILAADSKKLADHTAAELTNALARLTDLENKPALPDPALTKLADELKQQNAELKTQTDALKKDADEFKLKADDAKKIADDSRQQADDSKKILAEKHTALTAALARLGALEAKPDPFTPAELALLAANQKPKPTTQPTPVTPADPQEIADLITAAQRAFAKGDFELARDKSRAILTLQPTNQLVLGNLGAIELELGDPAAETHLKRALELKPDDAYCHSALGNLYFRAARYDDALTALSRAVQLNPEDAQAQNFLGMTLCQKGQRTSAEAAFRRAIQIDPAYAGAHHNLAVFYASKEPTEPGLARYHYDKAIAAGGQRSPDLEKLLDDAAKK